MSSVPGGQATDPRQSTVDTSLWIRRYHPSPDSPVRLVCFPHAGGSASFYFPVSAALTPGVEVHAVQYPGRQDRRAEPPVGSIAALADAVTEAVRPLADRPLAFFGHSLGAIVGYEVALRLEAAGLPPLVRFFASGRRAPSRYRPETVGDRDDQALLAELRLLAGTRGDVLGDPELIQMILPAVRADFLAIERYRHTPGQRLGCPVVALIGDIDPRVDEDEARDWAGHTTAGYDLRVFPGGHFYLVDQAAAVTRTVSTELSAALQLG